jgi:hypothetical protein
MEDTAAAAAVDGGGGMTFCRWIIRWTRVGGGARGIGSARGWGSALFPILVVIVRAAVRDAWTK